MSYQLKKAPTLLGLEPFGAADRDRTGTVLPPRDFKSLASAYSATPADASQRANRDVRMDGGGFEPPKQFAADLQSVPFGHSGIHPYFFKVGPIGLEPMTLCL